ncbi:MAG: creatininase family protein [Terriglobales bacterium]
MKRIFLFVLLSLSAFAQTQQLRVRWEELTAPDFRAGIEKSGGTCVLPFGILEKHGPHLPLGTDLLNVRKASLDAAQREYAIVFPDYYFGQIFEAQQEPGTIAYSPQLQMQLLQETTDEMSRNGCKKIIIVNGHGGNNSFLPYFVQTQMQKPHDYVVYLFGLMDRGKGGPPVKSSMDMHAGESETSVTMVNFPELVKLDQAKTQSGEDQHRQHLPDTLYTGIWWYARFPNHYSGDGSLATKEMGEYDMKQWTEAIVTAIKAVKADQETKKIQDEYYQKISHPLDTRP